MARFNLSNTFPWILSAGRNRFMSTGKLSFKAFLRAPLCLIIIIGFGFLGYNREWILGPQTQQLRPEKLASLASEEEIRSKFSYDGIKLFQQTQCTCQDKVSKAEVYELKNYLNPSEAESVRERRMKEYEHFRRRHQTQNILIAPPHSPLSYPIHGVQVMPLHTILLPGLKVYEDLPKYVVTLEASLGTFGTLVNAASIEGSIVSGRGEKRLIISTADQNVLNYILNYTTYTSTVYSIDSMDIVKFTINQHLAQFPVSIKQPAMVRLYDPGADKKISSLVTITTKTFLRYDKLRELLKSIRQFYPDIKVIVADDNEVPEKIEDEHVEQYIMPYAKGWFAGRNLAVSQVTTKYFLWVDDDFLFTGDTKIEKLVDVLEGTDLDLVGGSVAGNHFSFKLLLEEGGVDGDCLHWRGGSYQGIEGFPNCVLTGGVVNFFLAHTDRVLSVGFDPKLQRVAHTEFFIDALGRLRVGSCNHVTVGHQQKSTPSDGQMAQQAKKYNAFRTNTQEQVNYKLGLHYFKNRLRCFTKH